MKLIYVALLYFAIALVCIGRPGDDVNPGIKVGINLRGLEFLRDVALDYARDQLISLGLARIAWDGNDFDNIQINNFDLGDASLLTSPPNILTIATTGASMSLEADFTIEIVALRVSGRLTVSANAIEFCQDFELGRDDNNKPNFEFGSCAAAVGDLDIDITGGGFLGFPTNVVLNLFSGRVRDAIAERICPQIEIALEDTLNERASNLNVMVDFVYDTTVNLGLACDPVAKVDGILLSFIGRCYSDQNPLQQFPFQSTVIPALTSTTQMARISVGAYVLNTLFYSMWQNGVLMRTFTSEELLEFLGFNATTCAWGEIYPEVFADFDECYPVEVVLQSSIPPVAEFTPDMISIHANALVETNVVANESTTPVAFINATINVVADVMIQDGKIVGDIVNFTAVAVDSIGVDLDFINDLINATLSTMILPALNSATQSGYRLPEYLGYSFIGTEVELKEGAVEIGSDVTQG